MKLAVISDIHYPANITQKTILASLCGYTDDFYWRLEDNVQELSPDTINVFIMNGDFYWDVRYFARTPIIPPDWNFYNEHIERLKDFRKMLHKDIPLIIIEGNHDYWYQKYIFSDNGRCFLDKDSYFNHLIQEWRLNEGQIQKIFDLLDFDNGKMEIGNNIYLLQNEGLLINNTYIYGIPYYDREKAILTWANFRSEIIEQYEKNLEKILAESGESNLNIIICQHEAPQTPKLYYSLFKKPKTTIKYFFWGHKHTVKLDFIEKIKKFGSFQCVMPEVNQFKLQIYEI